MNAPVFVQKGKVSDNNPLILNSEGMNFNQIKVQEMLLKDKTRSSWLIGYIAKSSGGTDINIQVPTTNIDAISLSQIANNLGVTETVLSNLLNFDGQNLIPTRFIKNILISFSVDGGLVDNQIANWFKVVNHAFQHNGYQDTITFNPSNPLYSGAFTNIGTRFSNQVVAHSNLLDNDMKNILSSEYYFTADVELPKILAYEGKFIHYLGKYYKFHVVLSGSSNTTHDANFSYKKYSSLQTIAEDALQGHGTLNSNGNYDEFTSYADRVFLQMEEITDSSIIPIANAKISSNRKVTEGQQYDMIAIPADTLTLKFDNNGNLTPFVSNADISRRIISQLALDEDAKVYDIQLLPYCPVPSIKDSYVPTITGTEGEDYDYITVGDTSITYVADCQLPLTSTETEIIPATWDVTVTFAVQTESSKTVTVDDIQVLSQQNAEAVISNIVATVDDATGILTISYRYTSNSDLDDPLAVKFNVQYSYNGVSKVGIIFYCRQASFQTIIEERLVLKDSMKIDSQCDMYRLVSPNYQGSFEFNVAKNGGIVEYFTAYCTYKPYTPFIKVCPALNFVYGMDYNDNRGLICGGDFSLPRISSAWQSYQLNNKNYQNIFNREIQNLDFLQSIEARQQYITGGLSILSDTAKGTGAGAFIGRGAGAFIGATVGAGTSTLGYGADIDIMAKQHQEARSFAVDKYNYQLGNIKALPYTLTKVGSFDISSKIFPFLEYYTCSDEEKEALRRKIKYESMTIMAIGLFGDYYKAFDELTYFKGELIRCDDIADDSHMLDAIYAELLKGVYI